MNGFGDIMTDNLEMKKIIYTMSYTAMLKKWRFAPIGDAMFQGEIGEYFAQVMKEKRVKLGQAAHTTISKNIGWK